MYSDIASTQHEPIAIIGIGCRFPGGVSNVETYWNLLREGVDAITEIPSDRWDVDKFYDPDAFDRGKMCTRWGGFLNGIDEFDASFFKISRQEAARMDPQQRLVLEVAWEALEDAGQTRDVLCGSDTSVFIGVSSDDYSRMQLSTEDRDLISAYTVSGVIINLISNRLSYFFDLRGPSISLNTACSSSLVAVHQACSSLWSGECSLALAGGVNAILTPEVSIMASEATLLSANGRCKSFDAEANGYVRSEGCGVIVLKPLSKALADKDRIYSTIRASFVNQDGYKDSLTSPSQATIESLMKRTYQKAGITSGDIQYIEAHAMGTPVGDQVEALAIGKVLGSERPKGNHCWVGSVKTNIGHLESAAGIASLIKTALVLHYGKIPPNLHFNTPNPSIPWESLQIKIPQKLESWPQNKPYFASVNSFAIGGTNAHIVLEKAEQNSENQLEGKDTLYLLPLSAHTPAALHDILRGYLSYLKDLSHSVEGPSLKDICYTASLRRNHHQHRIAIIGESIIDLIQQLESILQGSADEVMRNSHQAALLQSFRETYVQGKLVDWRDLYQQGGRHVSLPPYPWQRKKYWHESEKAYHLRMGLREPDSLISSRSSDQSLSTKVERDPALGSFIPPQDEVEKKLVQLWEEILETQPIGVTDNFFELGGSSMLALKSLSRIESEFGKRLSLSEISSYQTIKDLAQFIRTGDINHSLVIPIRVTGKKAPLFFATPVFNAPDIFRKLVDTLDPDQPFYALRIELKADDPKSYQTFEEISQNYVSEIRKIQPHGPYHIGGYCAGSFLAHEIVRGLIAQGESVSAFVIIETVARGPQSHYPLSRLIATLLLGYRRIWLMFLKYSDFSSFIPEHTTSQQHRIQIARQLFQKNMVPEIRKYFRYQRWAVERYKVKQPYPPYPGKILVFLAEEEPGFKSLYPDAGWGIYANEGVETISVPGHHFNILLEEKSVKRVADSLTQFLSARTSKQEKNRSCE